MIIKLWVRVPHPFLFKVNMSKVAVGSIPKKITYVSAAQREVAVGCKWDISWSSNEDDITKTVKQKVLPTFPVDSEDNNTMQRALSWAKDGGWDHENKVRIINEPSIKEVDNNPISNVRVLSLEQRGQGGRAYKALIDDLYVDLREDVLMDTLLQSGVDVGGVLKGEYVWAKMTSNMKLVRVGSELHRLIVEFDSKKDIKPVSKNDLEVGGVYQDRKKNKAIFIGYVNTVAYISLSNKQAWQRYGEKPTFDFKESKIKKAMLFYDLYNFEKMEKQIQSLQDQSYQVYRFKIKKSHTYIEKVDQINISVDIIGFIRNSACSKIKDQILEYTGHRHPKINHRRIDGITLEENITSDSMNLNLYPYNGKEVEPFDVKKFLLFS